MIKIKIFKRRQSKHDTEIRLILLLLIMKNKNESFCNNSCIMEKCLTLSVLYCIMLRQSQKTFSIDWLIFFFFGLDFIFSSRFTFKAKLGRKYRDFSYTPIQVVTVLNMQNVKRQAHKNPTSQLNHTNKCLIEKSESQSGLEDLLKKKKKKKKGHQNKSVSN